MEIARTITSQESNLAEEQEQKIEVPEMMKMMMEFTILVMVISQSLKSVDVK